MMTTDANPEPPREDGQDAGKESTTTPDRTGCPRNAIDTGEREQTSSGEGMRQALNGAIQECGSDKFLHYPGLDGQKRKFLTVYAKCGNISHAAEATGISRQTHYDWLRVETYAAAFDEAVEYAGDALEFRAWQLANEGWFEPVFQGGEQVGKKWKFSESLLSLLLRATRPDKFRDNMKLEHAGGTSSNVTVRVVEDDTWYGNNAHSLDRDRLAAAPAVESPSPSSPE